MQIAVAEVKAKALKRARGTWVMALGGWVLGKEVEHSTGVGSGEVCVHVQVRRCGRSKKNTQR